MFSFSYDPGSSCVVVVVMWRVPSNRTDDEMLTSGARVLMTIEDKLPVYHTREMRRSFGNKFKKIGVDIPRHILRNIYSDLTLDNSAYENPAVDARMKQAIISEDPDMIIDLRHLNKGRPGDTFDIFFSQLEKKIDEIIAVDDRRHGVAHITLRAEISRAEIFAGQKFSRNKFSRFWP